MATAAGYLREASAAMGERYTENCVIHACRLAELLLGERRAPWIGRLRHVTGDFHWPLVPQRYLGRGGPAWSTHYVACAGRSVYDPLLGTPVDVDAYSMEVFGKPCAVRTHLDAAETARRLVSGELRNAFGPRAIWSAAAMPPL